MATKPPTSCFCLEQQDAFLTLRTLRKSLINLRYLRILEAKRREQAITSENSDDSFKMFDGQQSTYFSVVSSQLSFDVSQKSSNMCGKILELVKPCYIYIHMTIYLGFKLFPINLA